MKSLINRGKNEIKVNIQNEIEEIEAQLLDNEAWEE